MVATDVTPLIALDAVVIDTETTGLDARKARLVEFAGVRLRAGRIDSASSYRTLLRPGEPIPEVAVRIHGIDDGKVAGAPEFAAAWPAISGFIRRDVLIGHLIGFDLAVLQRECNRSGIAWQPSAALCTARLAQAVAPQLGGYSLEQVATWLDVEISGRHTALGDAETAGRIFAALIPHLRDRGIRTLAEAVRVCRSLSEATTAQSDAGWSELGRISFPEETPDRQPDIEPYRQHVRSVMHAPAAFIEPSALVGAALESMMRQKVSSLFVFAGDNTAARPDATGIITERDLLRSVSVSGSTALTLPVRQIMSQPLASIPADALSYLAIGRMNRLRVRHLGVTDAAGHIVGAVSARDLLRLRAEGAIELGDEIDAAKDVPELGRAWAKLARVAAGLTADGMSGREVAALVSQGVNGLTRRAAALAEAVMIAGGQGAAPCAYAVAVLGSAARGESLLAMDQDNALVFADGAPAGADRWFQTLGVHLADILHQVGVPYCQGGLMAKNPLWRGDVATWRQRIADWIGSSTPQDLLAVDIFFDLRPVYGEVALADRLWREAFAAARGQADFAKLLIETTGMVEPGRTWYGGIRTVQGRIDLKKAGLFGIVSVARALAICHHVIERATPARLEGIKALRRGLEADLDALLEAQGTFLDLILRQQFADIAAGIPATNRVEVRRLSRRERVRLGAALKAVEPLQEIAHDLLFVNE